MPADNYSHIVSGVNCRFLSGNLCFNENAKAFNLPVMPTDCAACSCFSVSSIKPDCVHLGSQRRCCDSLFICRKFKADCVKLLVNQTSDQLRCCETCESHESSESTS